ncbi:superoxide dismutase [Desulfovirgula thermocuniculi]|uniref:superoxide dismutase n=1 Tax=Desulfovirgula thermocuniculi TaxID=348842 RepID=UPI00041B751E|nr:superoxide dismutase [Desulfovirgula thermocuniculi]
MYNAITPKPLPSELLHLRGISSYNMQEHYKLYQGYVNKTNEIRTLLKATERAAANATYSPFRELKVEESYAYNGVKLHELYFGNLGGAGGHPPRALQEAMVNSFGSLEAWEEDFKACGLAARGWAVLAFDPDDGLLHNYTLDAHNVGLILNMKPLLVMDVYEHAYYMDYGTDRRGYIEAFWQNINWDAVLMRFRSR